MIRGAGRFRPFADVEAHLRNPTIPSALGYPDASIKAITQLHRGKDGGGTQSQLAKIALDNGMEFIVKQVVHNSGNSALSEQNSADRNIRRALGAVVADLPFVLMKKGETFGPKNALMIFPMVDGVALTHDSITSNKKLQKQWLTKVGAALGQIHLVCLQNKNVLDHFYENGCNLANYETLEHADLQASNVMLGRDGRVYLVDTEGTEFTKSGPKQTIKDLWETICFKDALLMRSALEGYLSNFEPARQQLILENIRAMHSNIPESAFPSNVPVTISPEALSIVIPGKQAEAPKPPADTRSQANSSGPPASAVRPPAPNRQEAEDLKAHETARRRAEEERQHIVSTVKADTRQIKKNIKAKLRELNAIKERFVRSPENREDERTRQDVIREIEILNGQMQQKILLLQAHPEEARKMRDELHLEKLSTTVETTIRDVKSAMSEALVEAARRQRIAEQERHAAEQARQAQEEARIQQEKARMAEEKRRDEQKRADAQRLRVEQARQAAEQEVVRQAQEREAARRRAEEQKRTIVAKVNSDISEIKKEIKNKLKELNTAKHQFVDAPENLKAEQKCQDLIQELDILDGQMQQKFLLLQSGQTPHLEEVRDIKDKLHLDKLATTMDTTVRDVKSAVNEAKEAARIQRVAEQQRQFAAELARQAQEASRIQEEKLRLAEEQRRNEQMRVQAQKLQEEKVREEQIRQAAAREEARKAQEKERQAQERSLQVAFEKAASDKAAAERAEQRAAEQRASEQKAAEQRAAEQRAAEQRAAEQRAAEQRAAEQRVAEQRVEQQRAEAAARAEQKRITEEQIRLEQERQRLEAERLAMASVKPVPVRDELKTQNQAQEQERQTQERARIEQARALEAERRRNEERIVRVRQAKMEQERQRTEQRRQVEVAAPPVLASIFSELAHTHKLAVEGFLTEFGTERTAIERALRDRYQGKKTEKKLKGLLQTFNANHGRVFTSKRDRQIGALAALLAKLQRDPELNAHEKGIVLSGALHSMVDNIQSTEKTNLFKSRLLTICQEMQTALHRNGIREIDPSYAKILSHVYEHGDAQKFRKVANDSDTPRQSIR